MEANGSSRYSKELVTWSHSQADETDFISSHIQTLFMYILF
jgi:hypothetical protein